MLRNFDGCMLVFSFWQKGCRRRDDNSDRWKCRKSVVGRMTRVQAWIIRSSRDLLGSVCISEDSVHIPTVAAKQEEKWPSCRPSRCMSWGKVSRRSASVHCERFPAFGDSFGLITSPVSARG